MVVLFPVALRAQRRAKTLSDVGSRAPSQDGLSKKEVMC